MDVMIELLVVENMACSLTMGDIGINLALVDLVAVSTIGDESVDESNTTGFPGKVVLWTFGAMTAFGKMGTFVNRTAFDGRG
jgi:hypothetical protein